MQLLHLRELALGGSNVSTSSCTIRRCVGIGPQSPSYSVCMAAVQRVQSTRRVLIGMCLPAMKYGNIQYTIVPVTPAQASSTRITPRRGFITLLPYRSLLPRRHVTVLLLENQTVAVPAPFRLS